MQAEKRKREIVSLLFKVRHAGLILEGEEGGQQLEDGGGLIYQNITLMEYSKRMKFFNKSPSADADRAKVQSG